MDKTMDHNNKEEVSLLREFFRETISSIKILLNSVTTIVSELQKITSKVDTTFNKVDTIQSRLDVLETRVNSITDRIGNMSIMLQDRPCVLETSKEDIKTIIVDQKDHCRTCMAKYLLYVLVCVLGAIGLFKVISPTFFK